ncbi:DEAD/DEAH box helicase, partial [Endobacter medicaginis]
CHPVIAGQCGGEIWLPVQPTQGETAMILTFDNASQQFLLKTVYAEGDAARSAGFRWDPSISRWYSNSASRAQAVAELAEVDEATLAIINMRMEAQQAAAAERKAAAAIQIAASHATSSDIEVPCGSGLNFMPYQLAGIAYAAGRENVLLADDMGLGKTAQAIGVLNLDTSLNRILIICPASLTRNWQREIERFGSRELTIGFATTKALPAADTNITIGTYDIFSRDTPTAAAIRAIDWDMLILDEAQYVKSRDAKRTLNILGGRKKGGEEVQGIKARRRLYLTGTPIMSRPAEAFTLLNSLAPRQFPSFFDYGRAYCNGHKTRFGWDFSGASNLTALQERLRSTIMVRRMKSDVLTDLPEKVRQLIELPADTPAARKAIAAESKILAQARAAKAALAALKAAGGDANSAYRAELERKRADVQAAFTEISRIRHDTALAKVDAVVELARDAAEGGKVILFAHHKDVISALQAGLQELGVVTITGDVPPERRQGIVDRFQNAPGVRVFIGNIQAAGVGLTLTASSHVIFAELDWTPAAMSQAEDRAHRLGQQNSVLVQHAVLEGSIDLLIAKRLVAKQRILAAALDSTPTAGDDADDALSWLD